MVDEKKSLDFHIKEVIAGRRCHENAFQSISRMILDKGFDKVTVNGKSTFDFKIFREGDKPLIGLYDIVTSFVNFVKEAAEGGSAGEMAYILIGGPGNGKTFFVEKVMSLYRDFLYHPFNKPYTFRFMNVDEFAEGYGMIKKIESQTFEDPMILAMNLLDASREKNIESLAKLYSLDDKRKEYLSKEFRPLGACSNFILNQLREYTDGDIKKILEFIEVVPVKLSETLGVITGKYSARDKITSSAADLLGEEDIQRTIHITDVENPFRYNVRLGALARVAGRGIHFPDELFKNKTDLIQVYLGVIQNRIIELNGYKWPIDTLIIATSNNDEFDKFKSKKEELPMVKRCRPIFVSHNTDYILQKKLTAYALGFEKKTTFAREELHEDPNLNYAASVAVVLSRLPKSEKLTPVETMKLCAGEIAGEKGIKALVEIIDELNMQKDVTKRFGQKGIDQRALGRALQLITETSETNEGKCMCALDIFNTLERTVYDEVQDSNDWTKYLGDIKIAKELYKEKLKAVIFDAYMDKPDAIKDDVMNYVNMVMSIDSEKVGKDKLINLWDSRIKQYKPLRIDEKFIEGVEKRIGLTTKEQIEDFRSTIRRIYGQKINEGDLEYDFMDNNKLVKAVTDVKLKSDIHGVGSVAGALSNRTNEENVKLYNRMMDTMINKLGYCSTCAQKTIEYYCTPEDES